MHILYRMLCRIFFLRPKAVPFFQVNPELDKMVKQLAAIRVELISWSLYGNPTEKHVAKEIEDQYVEEMLQYGEELKKYLVPYIDAEKKQPPHTYGKGEHHRWYLSPSVENYPRVDRIIPDYMLE